MSIDLGAQEIVISEIVDNVLHSRALRGLLQDPSLGSRALRGRLQDPSLGEGAITQSLQPLCLLAPRKSIVVCEWARFRVTRIVF